MAKIWQADRFFTSSSQLKTVANVLNEPDVRAVKVPLAI